MSDADLLQDVVLPLVHDPDVVPLYVDADHWTGVPAFESTERAVRRGAVGREMLESTALRLSDFSVLGAMEGRHGFRVAPSSRVSFGTYFNAFPASYWMRWTELTGVRLVVETSGVGQVLVYRSNARGVSQRVDSAAIADGGAAVFDLPLDRFVDGGWYWFDLVAEDADFALERAGWWAPPGSVAPRRGTTSVAITTLNRAEYLLPLLESIAQDAGVLELIDRVYVIDQGSRKVRGAPAYAGIERQFEGKLAVIEQDNLGGSGGFSRGMLETLRAGESDAVLLLDDDVAIEPEGVRRAVRFADWTATPTIVGGHMFDMYDRSRLHAYAEGFDMTSFMWGATSPTRHDFAVSNLRQTSWLHRRLDAQYNGWWMCLIPVEVIRRVGLAAPVFIKWDDAEYGLRAGRAGVPTVSLPGSAVWHVSWVDKDDTIDWQAFFHARNRILAALLHSPRPRGGSLMRRNLALDIKHLFGMQYFAQAARIEAYRSVLDDPGALHGELRNRLGRVRALLDDYPDGRAIPFREARGMAVVESALEEGRRAPVVAPTGRRMVVFLAWTLLRNVLRDSRRDQHEHPSVHLPFEDARWWVVPTFDSVAMTNADGSGVLWYRRDRPTFLRMLRESARLRREIRRRWPELAARSRAALPGLVSPERWDETFSASAEPPTG